MEDVKIEIKEDDSSQVYGMLDEWRRRVFGDGPYQADDDRVMF